MSVPTNTERREISVRGIVQGVGFRPFVYSLAQRYRLSGLVNNDAAGVHVEVEGPSDQVEIFLRQIEAEAPPLAVVETVTWQRQPVRRDTGFRIEESRDGAVRQALVSPDVATCAQCRAELFSPLNRRYRYPFINCTNCGPRFTITRSVPYDRSMTTMAGFPLCPACRQEYDDPADRRFHAQPNACAVCGPRVRLVDATGRDVTGAELDPIADAARLLREGAIVAVKGLGGYHLSCNPFSHEAVGALRARKARQDKPFALMAPDLAGVRELCRVSPDEESLLTAPARPIVLLDRRHDGQAALLADDVAPRQATLGVMLAYTPVHHLLLHDAGIPLVMTSGNRSDEPISYRDEEVFDHLGHIADYFLVHDRPIHIRCDDSVVRVRHAGQSTAGHGTPYPVRRSRGYAPGPLTIVGGFGRHVLACGAHLKNTFCLGKDRYALVSHHIGDLENYETLRSYKEGIEHYCRLFDVKPQLVACDLHPDYLSTTYAREREEEGLALVAVQHHHAHIAACLVDNERPATEQVIGVAFDGTGYGTDGTIWGGEFLLGSLRDGFSRRAYLEPIPLPGGEAAIRQPWRIAVACLWNLYGASGWDALPLALVQQADAHALRPLRRILDTRRETPWLVPETSSAGRLFDAVAALVGVPGSRQSTYEGQAAIELELAAHGPTTHAYPCTLRQEGEHCIVQTGEILSGVVEDLIAHVPAARVSSRFHGSMAQVVLTTCMRIREDCGVNAVALSGGTFQNMLLLRQVVAQLQHNTFSVYLHHRVPTNDGGLSLGQAVLADSAMQRQN
ncbi:MAG: carbamoyltransferase HypF [Chloroflexota bacterium]